MVDQENKLVIKHSIMHSLALSAVFVLSFCHGSFGVIVFDNMTCISSNKTVYANYSCVVKDGGTPKSNINVYVLLKEPVHSAIVRKCISNQVETKNKFL